MGQREPPFKPCLDPIRVIKITDESDQLIGIIANYQGHPVQLPQKNHDISAEYPEAVLQRHCISIFQPYYTAPILMEHPGI